MPRLIGCDFVRVFYVPYFVLIVHDGRKLIVLDPLDLYNLTVIGHRARFSVPRITARQLQWTSQ